MNDPRRRAAEQMMSELLGYLIDEVFPGADFSDPEWTAMDGPDKRMTRAISEYERGVISFQDLEAEGVRYVEAWQAVSTRD